MAISTNSMFLAQLFSQAGRFVVPSYQRAYAWDSEPVDDFLSDLLKFAEGSPPIGTHFFGGVVVVETAASLPPVKVYEVIDGQQRLATTSLFCCNLAVLLDEYADHWDEHNLASEDEAGYLRKHAKNLRETYVVKDLMENTKSVEHPKLSLSRADNGYFQDLLAMRKEDDIGDRPSHSRLHKAHFRIWERLVDLFGKDESVDGVSKMAYTLTQTILGARASVILMVAENRSQAYQIFEVLNNRGVQLSEGDLLRARTLESVNSPKFAEIQEKCAIAWDAILEPLHGSVDKAIRWYLSWQTGRRPGHPRLAGQFLKERLPKVSNGISTKSDANAVLKEVEVLRDECSNVHRLLDGEWPYITPKASNWMKQRLRNISTVLRHSNAMPLLLSLKRMSAAEASLALSGLERFVFRFKTIGNKHIGPASAIYCEYANRIRTEHKPKAKPLLNALNELMMSAVPDDWFVEKLKTELSYRPDGGNGILKYLLITLDDFSPWLAKNHQGKPKYTNVGQVLDPENLSIEHVYPQGLSGSQKHKDMEPLKHSLGNLTLLSLQDNVGHGNKMFSAKKSAYAASTLSLNTEIAKQSSWGPNQVVSRTNQLAEAASRVFKM